MEERGHGAFTLESFLARDYLEFAPEGEPKRFIKLSAKGRAALASVPAHKLGKPNPRKHKR